MRKECPNEMHDLERGKERVASEQQQQQQQQPRIIQYIHSTETDPIDRLILC